MKMLYLAFKSLYILILSSLSNFKLQRFIICTICASQVKMSCLAVHTASTFLPAIFYSCFSSELKVLTFYHHNFKLYLSSKSLIKCGFHFETPFSAFAMKNVPRMAPYVNQLVNIKLTVFESPLFLNIFLFITIL